ncbi:MAG: FAD-binding oxidoreductase [Gammaproteobacteria bacterium]|nr:FAD-binding oxidoreductase [Gammaproteobacteria bacterium]
MDRKTQVVIIGGGIVGCSAAYFMARSGVSVVLCEKATIAAEQSSRNWGFVRQQGRDPAEVPLMKECIKIWETLEKDLESDIEWVQGGNIRVALDQEQLGRYEAWMQIARDNDLDSRLLTAKELSELLPTKKTFAGALYTPSDGQAEPALVAPALARAAERLGAEVITDCAVTNIELTDGAVSAVMTERGRIDCELAVCACGAWTSRVVRELRVEFPQLWIKNSVARSAPLPHITDAGVWASAAFRQRRDGSLNIALGGEAGHDLSLDTFRFRKNFKALYQLEGSALRIRAGRLLLDDALGRLNHNAAYRVLDPKPNIANLKDAVTRLEDTFPQVGKIHIDRSWAGYIDCTPDLIPVIDALNKPRGLIVASGLSGHGFGLGPIVGRLVAEIVTKGQTSLPIGAFRMTRFAEGTVQPMNVV